MGFEQARVIVALSMVMDPDQRIVAATNIRALQGDDTSRTFFEAVAGSLEQLNADQAREEA